MRLILACLLCFGTLAAATPGISEKTKGMKKHEGFQTFYWDEEQGKVWLEVSRFSEEFLYISSLPAGIGSNDIGLDRGQLGQTRVVRWERSGPKVLLVQSNYDYRARTENADERRAVKDSFAESVVWGFRVEALDGQRVLVDATDFYLNDAHNVAGRLQQARQGSWRTDPGRSAIYLERTRNFPDNTEVEATVTFTGGPAGEWLRSVSPSGSSVTVREHRSFVRLPGPGFEPREFDPRSGFFALEFYDYSTPVSESVVKRYIRRHRLQKKDPGAAVSEPVKPIVYYLDRGTPEPVRSALLDGARWWAAAFEAAGFRNAFRVEMLPEDADPMDVRYNVIQWVHRSTRGWSYGASVTDPRTGEILKGHVTLGSLRVRQDYLIAEAFLAPYAGGAVNPSMLEMSLARLRQLSAHEVGHTLGLGHNYIASAQRDASVMDYPHPYITMGANGVPDLSKAYGTAIGEWDKVSINWGYREFAKGADAKPRLNAIIDEARGRGLTFLTDQDARPAGSAHPEAHLWDNGANAAAELTRLLDVRAKAIARFGENNIKPGMPMAMLEDVFVPLYFSHRYQAEAAVKALGGLRYTYALRGDGQAATTAVPVKEQMAALDALLAALKPETLDVPKRIADLIPPRPEGYEQTRELFKGRTGMTFDPLAAAETAADMVLGLVLDAERAARLAQSGTAPADLKGVLARLTQELVKSPGGGAVRGAVAAQYLRRLMALAAHESTPALVRDAALAEIDAVKLYYTQGDAPLRRFMLSQIAAFEKDPKQMSLPRAPEPPPGMPIGMDDGCGIQNGQ